MKNKKTNILILLFGMISLSFNQIKTEVDINIVTGAIIGSIGVASYAAYKTYQKYYQPLSYTDKEILFKKIIQDKQGSDMNFDYVAHITQNMNLYTFEILMNEALTCADKDGFELVMMKHIFMASHILWPNEKLIDLEEEFEEDLMKYPDHIRAVALHEAGHAVATLCSGANNFLYIYKLDLQSDITRNRRKVGKNYLMPLFCDEASLTEEELQYFAKVDLGGYASEIVFQQFGCDDQQLDGNDTDCLAAHVDQILRMRSNGLLGAEEQPDECVQLTREIFQESCQLIVLHKDKVEKLALALLKKKILYADEIYELCGVEKPKLEIRKKSV